AQQFFYCGVKKLFRAALKHLVGGLQASSPAFRIIGASLGIAEHQARDASAKSAPEFEQRVAADGDPNEGCAADTGILQTAHKVTSMLLHGGGTFAHVGVSMAAKIGKDHAILGDQRLGSRLPEFMVRWKRMEQDDGSSVAQDFVGDFGVTAANTVHIWTGFSRQRQAASEFVCGAVGTAPSKCQQRYIPPSS